MSVKKRKLWAMVWKALLARLQALLRWSPTSYLALAHAYMEWRNMPAKKLDAVHTSSEHYRSLSQSCSHCPKPVLRKTNISIFNLCVYFVCVCVLHLVSGCTRLCSYITPSQQHVHAKDSTLIVLCIRSTSASPLTWPCLPSRLGFTLCLAIIDK